MSVSVTIDAKKLMALPGAIIKAREQALEDTAMQINRDAKKMAPVDYGRLRTSLHIERPGETSHSYTQPAKKRGKTSKTPDAGGNYDGKVEVTVKVGERVVGSNVEYAAAKEFGTSRAWPHPFLRPAYHRHRNLLKERMIKRINDAIGGATK